MQRNDEVLTVEPCDICGDVGYPELIVTCFKCNVICEHCYCMQILLNEVPDVWFCESCQSKNGTTSPCKVNQDAGLQASKRQQTVRTGKAYVGSKNVTPKIPSLALKSNPCISPMALPRNEVQKNQMTDHAPHSSSKGQTKEHRLVFERRVCDLILDKKAKTLDLHVEKPAKGAPSKALTAIKSIAIAGSGAVAECNRSDIEKRIIRVFRIEHYRKYLPASICAWRCGYLSFLVINRTITKLYPTKWGFLVKNNFLKLPLLANAQQIPTCCD